MGKADTGVKLLIACKPLLKTRRTDKDQVYASAVMVITQLFEAVGGKSVGLRAGRSASEPELCILIASWEKGQVEWNV